MTRRDAVFTLIGIAGMIFAKGVLASDKKYDGVTAATAASECTEAPKTDGKKVLLILVSLHHKNTEKVALEMATVLDARIVRPQEIGVEDLEKYELIGFGSGIYDQKHHKSMLDLVDKMPNNMNRKVFLFSTSGVSRKTCLKHSMEEPHTVIREKLHAKACTVVDEFNCTGWNTNVFLKLFGGINRGKPDAQDLQQARLFAKNLKY